MKKYIPLIAFAAAALAAIDTAFAAKPSTVPTIREWTDGTGAAYKPSPSTRVVTPADSRASLVVYARDFAEELGVRHCAGEPRAGDIVMELVEGESFGREGYSIVSTVDSIRIRAETAVGAYWATRTLKQSFDRTGEFPAGTAKDFPDYPVRGFMFDCGRKPFALSTLKKIVDICSYYKINDLQLHLSDNYIWLHNYPGVKNAQDILSFNPTAGGFRLESKVRNLASTDLFYTKAEFRELVSYARRKGVKIVPELDVPGHALQFVRARPDLMYKGSVGRHRDLERAAMLDLSNPGTFDFVASVFDEYIDSGVFANNVIHIGTDEYYGDPESYRAFTDRLLRHIKSKGKTPRFWGSLSMKKGNTPVVVDGIEMHVWSLDWQKPLEAVNAGYKIINILDRWTYVVPNGRGNIGCYCDDIDTKAMYENWGPRVFPGVAPSNLPKDRVLGAAWAMWNDNSFLTDPGLCGRDLLARIAKNCAVVSERTWLEGKSARSYDEFLSLVKGDLKRLGAEDPAPVSKTFKTAKVKKPLYRTDELTLWASSPVNGKVGFRREGAEYTFDYEIPYGKTVELTFESANRKATLKVDGIPVGGTPRREHFPDSCRYFTLPF